VKTNNYYILFAVVLTVFSACSDPSKTGSDSGVNPGADAAIPQDGSHVTDGSRDASDGANDASDAGVDAGSDAGSDAGLDSGFDAGLTDVAGVNFYAATLPGPIADMEMNNGKLYVMLTDPPSIYQCTVNGIQNAECVLKASLPAGLNPVSFNVTPAGYAVAVASPAAGYPIDLMKVDLSGVNPSSAVKGRKSFSKITVSSGGGEITLDLRHPHGVRGYVVHTETVEHYTDGGTAVKVTDRDHAALAVEQAASDGGIPSGLVLSFWDLDGDWAKMKMPGLVKGTRTTALGITKMDPGADGGTYGTDGGTRDYLVALNSGIVDIGDPWTAGFAIFDHEASSMLRVGLASLGEVATAGHGRVSFTQDFGKALAAVESPGNYLAIADLKTGVVSQLSLAGKVTGSVTDLVSSGNEAFAACAEGVVFIDLDGPAVKGTLVMPLAPSVLAASGKYLYIASGNRLFAVDTGEAGLKE